MIYRQLSCPSRSQWIGYCSRRRIHLYARSKEDKALHTHQNQKRTLCHRRHQWWGYRLIESIAWDIRRGKVKKYIMIDADQYACILSWRIPTEEIQDYDTLPTDFWMNPLFFQRKEKSVLTGLAQGFLLRCAQFRRSGWCQPYKMPGPYPLIYDRQGHPGRPPNRLV